MLKTILITVGSLVLFVIVIFFYALSKRYTGPQ
jgi:hypothetical protein